MSLFLSRPYPRASLVTQAAAYSSGELIGGKQSFQLRTPGGGFKLTRYFLKSLTAVSQSSVLYLFDSDPSATTFTENGAFSLNSADRTRLIARVAIASGDWVNDATPLGLYTVEKTLNIPGQFAAGDRTIYGALVLGGSHTPGSTADLEAILAAEVDLG